MEKDFDIWNKLKKEFNSRQGFPYVNRRDIWWCSLGVNIGVEIDGKNENYERPVIVLRAFNTEMLLVIPLTTKEKIGKSFYKLQESDVNSTAVLSQIRLVSAKRMIRKIGKVSESDFKEINIRLSKLFK